MSEKGKLWLYFHHFHHKNLLCSPPARIQMIIYPWLWRARDAWHVTWWTRQGSRRDMALSVTLSNICSHDGSPAAAFVNAARGWNFLTENICIFLFGEIFIEIVSWVAIVTELMRVFEISKFRDIAVWGDSKHSTFHAQFTMRHFSSDYPVNCCQIFSSVLRLGSGNLAPNWPELCRQRNLFVELESPWQHWN